MLSIASHRSHGNGKPRISIDFDIGIISFLKGIARRKDINDAFTIATLSYASVYRITGRHAQTSIMTRASNQNIQKLQTCCILFVMLAAVSNNGIFTIWASTNIVIVPFI